ncbi:hypothetical protein CHS0354_024992 [Potamilus streckersoni]|uniref:Uncharacterized protein n=1 Tax=Potamilus streckersoni TaxID=2493646 RepID=A0AAE0W743_9BIVA|nr:hypothetical protein CHS0354_024992 [Potamilus streckersoni]
MIYRLVMTGTFLLSVGLFSMIAGSLGKDSSICSTWELDHDSENNQDSSIILLEKNDCPLIYCALFCGMDPSCKSFFHHPSSEMCLGSQSYKRGLPDSQAVQQGWKYYTRM